MRHGHWIPLSKAFRHYLPKDRPYSKLEAAYSIQLDYDKSNAATISGYADLWQWSRKKVRNFLKQLSVELIYPGDTKKKQNQKGQIRVQIGDRSGTDKEQIRLIDSKDLQEQKNRKGTDKEQIRDRSGTTTRDPNPKPNPNSNKYTSDSDEIRLSSLLFDLIRLRNPKHKTPNMQAWAKHIDRAMRLDNRTPAELEAIIRWSQSDPFWQNNILSTEKIRDQFDQLWMKREQENADQSKFSGTSKTGRSSDSGAEPAGGKYSHLGTTLSN